MAELKIGFEFFLLSYVTNFQRQLKQENWSYKIADHPELMVYLENCFIWHWFIEKRLS